jgi:hypothetical protein
LNDAERGDEAHLARHELTAYNAVLARLVDATAQDLGVKLALVRRLLVEELAVAPVA